VTHEYPALNNPDVPSRYCFNDFTMHSYGRSFLGLILLGLFGILPLAGAQNSHHIIMLDTSGSMLAVLDEGAPNPRQVTRIDAIKGPFKKHIDGVPIGDTLHLYQFNKGLQPNNVTITLLKAADRAKAKQWVDNIKIATREITNADGNKERVGRPTFLYSSLDKVLVMARVLLDKHGQAPSLLIISDGEDTEKNGPFKDMAAVLKKHGAIFEKLPTKVFCAIVKFNLDSIKKPFEDAGGVVALPEKMPDVFKPVIRITANFITDLPGTEAYIGQVITFKNQTKTVPPRQLARLKPDALQYEWDFGDGSKSKLPSPQHFFRKPGTYNITLTATNPENRANIATKKLVLTIRPVVPRIEAGKKTAVLGCPIHQHLNPRINPESYCSWFHEG
jgi:hypothetical protein